MKFSSSAALVLSSFYVTFSLSAANVDYATIADANAVVTGVRSDSATTDSVVLTARYASTQAGLYEGSLEGALTAPSSSWHTLTPVFSGETVTSANFYGPNTYLFDPSLGAGNVVAVGTYYYTESPAGPNASHGLLYLGPITGGGTWTQIDASPLVHGGETLLNTIAHSTMGALVVGNYDTDLATGKAFIYDRVNDTWRDLNPGGTASVTAYGIWQNGGSSSTSYTIAGGQSSVGSDGIDESYLVDYDSATHVFTHYTVFPYNNVPNSAILSHFDGITGTSTGYNLTGFVTDVSTNPVSGFFVAVTRNADGSFTAGPWVNIAYPGSSVTTGNTIVGNKVLGIYLSGPHSYIATVLPGVDVSVKKSGAKATFTITNTGAATDSFDLSRTIKVANSYHGPSAANPRKSALKITYSLGGANVTKALESHTATTGALAPGGSVNLVEKVKTTRPLAFKRTIKTTIHATSETDASQTASAKVKLVVPTK
jgi:hypothetical protein